MGIRFWTKAMSHLLLCMATLFDKWRTKDCYGENFSVNRFHDSNLGARHLEDLLFSLLHTCTSFTICSLWLLLFFNLVRIKIEIQFPAILIDHFQFTSYYDP